MKYLLIIVVFFVGLNCSAQDHVDGLYSYSVPTTACFLRSVYCGELRNMIGVTKNQVSHDEKEISNLYNALKDTNNFKLDTSLCYGSNCLLIDFKDGMKIVYTVCWYSGGIIRINDKMYKYNKKVEKLLMSYYHVVLIKNRQYTFD